MTRRKRWAPKKDSSIKGTKYDSLFEKSMHETVLKDTDFHSSKIEYTVPHTYEADFTYEKNGKIFLIETKGRFRDGAEARKYTFIKEVLPENTELIFIMEKANTVFPFAKKRKDGTKMTHEEYLDKHGIRYWVSTDFSLDYL